MSSCFGVMGTINTDNRIDGRLLRAYTERRGRVGFSSSVPVVCGRSVGRSAVRCGLPMVAAR